MICKEISQSIVFVGSNIKAEGGIAELLRSYSALFEDFQYVRCTCKGNIIIRFLFYIFSLFKLTIYLFKPSIKIVHIHSSSFILLNKTAIYILLARIFKKKIILHLHGGALDIICSHHHSFLVWLFKRVDIIVCVSKYIEQIVKKHNLSNSTIVIYNIIPTPKLQTRKKKGDRISLVFLGKICDTKGIFDVIDVIKSNISYFKNRISLTIGGWGEIERLNNIIKENKLEDIIYYKGWIEGEKKSDLLNISDIYIQPTYFESLGISILEAMSYGLPVISSNIGGVPEIVHNGLNGFLIKPKDKNSLFKKMTELIESPSLREKMGDESSKIASSFFPGSIEKKLVRLYKNLLYNI